MNKRFLSIWLPLLKTDWMENLRPSLRQAALVIATPVHGRLMITAANSLAIKNGVTRNMVLADARAILHSLEVIHDKPGIEIKLLKRLALSCIRFTPVVAMDGDDGLMLDITGCAHLWGDEQKYLDTILSRFKSLGYHVRTAISDTPGSAWGIARFGQRNAIIPSGEHGNAILPLNCAALRLEQEVADRLNKLGLSRIHDFIGMPRASLRRRFGQGIIIRIEQALGQQEEPLQSVVPVTPYLERLPALDPIVTRTGIEIGLHQLIGTLSVKLRKEGRGFREAILKCYRIDGKCEVIRITTTRATTNEKHLFKLFENKIDQISPYPGIELFTLEASVTNFLNALQEKLWDNSGGLADQQLSELLDKFVSRFGSDPIKRYLPVEHHWPERSIVSTLSLEQVAIHRWKHERPRPVQLLATPERIDVTAPIPDYPPMLFRYRNKLHKIMKADGPERIEQEWWISQGEHRDYYHVEDESGARYWLFRLGHYTGDKNHQWFLHGFYA